MAFFPQSLMPARIKSEAADVDGNRYIMSGDDHNRLDEEIRAIEKALLGVQTGGGGSSGTIAQCSTLEVLLAIAQQLQLIRDTMVDSTSGVVAVKDSGVAGVDGIIPFPASWHTTLVSDIPDNTATDEQDLPAIPSVTVTDASGMPNEGFVTIINDVSLGQSIAVHSKTFSIYSSKTANGKVGQTFVYEILTTKAATFQVDGLPAGLSLSGNAISGTPTTAATSPVKITATAGAETTTLSLSIHVFEASSPTILDPSGNPTSTLSATATVGVPFSYDVKFEGSVVSMTATDQSTSLIPPGLTVYGQYLSGTPRIPTVYSLDIVVTDEAGDSATAVLTLTVGA
jgi:hypothetical protein